MYVFHSQLLPTGGALLLGFDRPLNATFAKDMPTSSGRLILHCIHANHAPQFPLLLFLLHWRVRGKTLHERRLYRHILPFPALQQKEQNV